MEEKKLTTMYQCPTCQRFKHFSEWLKIDEMEDDDALELIVRFERGEIIINGTIYCPKHRKK